MPAHVAAALFVSHGFTAAPVVDDDDRVIGIATEADLVRGRITAEGSESVEERPEPTVADVMTEAPVVGRSDDDLAGPTSSRSCSTAGSGRCRSSTTAGW